MGMKTLRKCAATLAILTIGFGLTARPASAAYGSMYLYETVTTMYPYASSYNRYLIAGPFESYSACDDYRMHIPANYEQGILRSYSCGY